MIPDSNKAYLTFIWRAKEITSAVIELARNNGVRALFDLDSVPLGKATEALLIADGLSDCVDVKLNHGDIENGLAKDFIIETGLDRVWVEIQSFLPEQYVDRVLGKISDLSQSCEIIPVVSDPGHIAKILHNHSSLKSIGLKGAEASGFVGSETAFNLFGTLKALINENGLNPKTYIWGTVSRPELAAAFLAAGADGIVFESIHWLTDLVDCSLDVKQKISNLKLDHTDLVGGNLGVYCRLYNKGNSKSVRDLRHYAGSLCGSEIGQEQKDFFAERIQSQWTDALESKFGREELIPLGVEAVFAADFAREFGDSSEKAIGAFAQKIARFLSESGLVSKKFINSEVAKEMGTTYPFIQGAMSWITDDPDFASRVAQSGALPTIALGLMDRGTLDTKLGSLPERMNGRPFAVNVITLSENPHREGQLAWIESIRPRFAVVAAGEPSHASQLKSKGIDPIYIAPNEDLLKLALDLGIQYIILEGSESGGHVGIHSTMTLAQTCLSLRDKYPKLFSKSRIILAGGIFDRRTAFMAAMVGADGIQMGTCYLSCKEIVESGALSELYQRVVIDAAPGSTVVTGEGVGLRVRSIRTSRIEQICDIERGYSSGQQDEGAFRREIEALSAGSLFVAAKSLDRPGGVKLTDSEVLQRGQFMSGACAGAIKKTQTLEQLHRILAGDSVSEVFPVMRELDLKSSRVSQDSKKSQFSRSRKSEFFVDPGRERIAITGMSVVNSLGNSPEQIWNSTLAMRSGITEVPLTKWDHSEFYNPRPRVPEKTYCKFGAFQNLELSRKELGIPPQDFRTMAAATKVTMWLAQKAIEESGILNCDIPREKISVLISQNAGEAASTLEEMIVRASVNKILRDVKRAIHLTPEQEVAVEKQIKSGRLAVDDTTLLGRLNCSAGGFICNKYGFMGPSFSVSAACATALVALYTAFQLIRNGIIDAAVIGGAEELLTPMHFLEFSALGALAGLSGSNRRASEVSRPFDADRDGMVLGEGGGMLVIEKESVAVKRGARIHGFITGMGAGNNNRGMIESSRVTQIPAISASFHSAGYGPDMVQYVECHATSTKQGDIEEVQALKSVFGSDHLVWLGSFKSQIGHTLGASGVNSLIRGIMAMNSGVIPPTLNYEKPDLEMELDNSSFKIASNPEQWPDTNGSPRRFQVNAFGFGGSNYVVQLEQNLQEEAQQIKKSVFGVANSSVKQTDLPEVNGVVAYETDISGKKYRIAVVAESKEKAQKALVQNEIFSNGNNFTHKRIKALAKQGIFLGDMSETVPPLAFVFPGQGSHYAGMGMELYNTFPVIRHWMNRAADVAEFDILKLLFYDKEEDLQKTRWQQPALFTLEYAMVQYLTSLGVKPTAMAGHSLGELTALCLAGVYSFEDGFRLVNKRAICMDKACSINMDPGVMMACDAPMEVIDDLRKNKDKVYITNINSPNQIVIGGDTDQVKEVGAKLKEMGHRSTLLRVSMAFHSPIMACIHDELEEFVDGIEFHSPQIPVISNTTMEPFTDNPDEIRRTVMAHLESCVNWMPNVKTLWNDYGIRLFVEVGPREILSNLILDTINDVECVQTCLPSAETVIFRNAIGQLYAKGNLNLGITDVPTEFASPGVAYQAPKTQELLQNSSAKSSQTVSSDPIERIVHREIGSFVYQSFGRFIKPSLIESIRREVDPSCSEADLDMILSRMFNLSQTSAFIPGAPLPNLPTIEGIPQKQITGTDNAVAASDKTEKAELDVTEKVIQIIMEVTGYEREEIEPEMDLREDLSIRSSRLPVIMDAVEGQFRIKVELEEFMDVRTIKDLADRISLVLDRNLSKKLVNSTQQGVQDFQIVSEGEGNPADDTLKRLIFRRSPLSNDKVQPVELSPLDSVVIISATVSDFSKKVGDVFRRDYGVNILNWKFLENSGPDSYSGSDLRTFDGANVMAEKLSKIESVSGLVLVLDNNFRSVFNDLDQLSQVLTGYFIVLKKFLESSSKKLAFTVRNAGGIAEILEEGVLGVFLTGALEFSSVQFRSLSLEQGYELTTAIRAALDRSYKPLRLISDESGILTECGFVEPVTFVADERLILGKQEVVVISGGCSGITSCLAQGLGVFGLKIIFVGRTDIDDESFPKALDTRKILNSLQSTGIDAHYYSCDVTDSVQTKATLEQIAKDHGPIRGIIHGAGYLKDSFIKLMANEDFKGVVDVKYLGVLNLFGGVDSAKLKFFFSLSSAAAVQGNPGQVNYSSGNRMMSALGDYWNQKHPSIKFKSLELPPVEGVGMAENEEVRSLMKRMNASYITLEELSGMFTRELVLGSSQDSTVLFMKTLPVLSTAPLDTSIPEEGDEMFMAGSVLFKRENFPLIDRVKKIDMASGLLEAQRVFEQRKDLWISDHKPFKFLDKPLVSAIMALETFMESAQILYPGMMVRGVRDAKFLDIIEVGANDRKVAEIYCKRLESPDNRIMVEATMTENGSASSARSSDKAFPNYRAMIILDSGVVPDLKMDDFPVDPKELDTIPLNHDEVQAWYDQRSDLQGRYRVIDLIEGSAQGSIRGQMVYPDVNDFYGYRSAEYAYSPYLFEAIMHVMNFYGALRDPSKNQPLIPFGIGELTLIRNCKPAERITIEARRNSEDEKGVSWNARAMDEAGGLIMFAQDVRMRWFKI